MKSHDEDCENIDDVGDDEEDDEEEEGLALYANQWSIRKIPRTPAWETSQVPAIHILYHDDDADDDDDQEEEEEVHDDD